MTTHRIRILPDTVANQIAAGEVVERPASVVKELVENALDAGAGRIEIRIESGGKRLIRVSDDGTGMARGDALLSVDRHATSKIEDARDLAGIRTLGFRGEALPSIGAVSRLAIDTRASEEEVGTTLRIEAGRMVGMDSSARRRGTTVEVRTLFFNAPARSRFLRSTSAETRAVSDTIVQLALGHPGVAFHLASDDRVLLDLPPVSEIRSRIATLWGEESESELLPVSGEGEGFVVQGLVQRPDRVRPGFRRAHLFLQGRPFRDAALLRAVDRAYLTTVPPGHRPWVFLYLRSPDGGVDVNVHPTKAEVRFRDAAAIERLVEATVRRGLEGEESVASLDPRLSTARSRGGEGRMGGRESEEVGERSGADSLVAHAAQTSFFLRGGRDGSEERSSSGSAPVESPSGTFSAGQVREEPSAPRAGSEVAGGGAMEPAELSAGSVSGGSGGSARLWQVLNRYILAETRDGLLLIDQHAAHERILFERLMRSFDRGGIESQQLLFPLTLRLARAEVEMVLSMKELFGKAGFQVDGFGDEVVVIHAVPAPHRWFDPERAFRGMVEELTHGSPLMRSARNQVERLAMTFACKAAIKAGEPLGEAEITELFDALFATELPYHDVHGRPTTVRLSRAELERSFGR